MVAFAGEPAGRMVRREQQLLVQRRAGDRGPRPGRFWSEWKVRDGGGSVEYR